MSTVDITQATFESVVQKPGIVLLDWWATWCGPCRSFAPVYERASQRHADVTFGKVDTEAEQRLAAAFEIRAIPTLMLFRDGVLLFEHAGMLPAQALDKLVDQARALDMAEVKKKLADPGKTAAAG